MIKEQQLVLDNLNRVAQIFKSSAGKIRPHFILTGPSGSGKSHLMQHLAAEHELGYLEVNAAQLTKEGTSGNSLSKALAGLANKTGSLTICFVDEFDKLFISGNSNTSLAHETTNGVQNEFLKVLESRTTSVFGDYGKYTDINIENVLFVFAGAFNGEEKLTVDRLRDFGIKTEFLGRVGLVYNLTKLSLDSMYHALIGSKLLATYLALFPGVKQENVVNDIMTAVAKVHEQNTLGIRLLTTMLHQYFINDGKLDDAQVEQTTFQTTLTFNGANNAQH